MIRCVVVVISVDQFRINFLRRAIPYPGA
jgi:hypothetical protein